MAGSKITVNAKARDDLEARIRAAAEIIAGKMETNAKQHISEEVYDSPPSWYTRTGLLRNSITTQVAEDGGDIVIAVGTNVEYAAFVELGTGAYAEGESRAKHIPWTYKGSDGKFHTTSGMVARPYLRPAVENHVEEYKKVLVKMLSE